MSPVHRFGAILLLLASILPATAFAERTRHYYVQAEDVIWDFAPTNQNLVHGGPIPDPWTNSHIFPMVRYIEYTDNTFSTPKPQSEWLGILGPIIRAEVGDEVVVHFRNRAFKAGGSYGMHPHGFRYTKDNEGAHYMPAGAGAQIPPGGQFEYHWFADRDSAPGPGDPSSLVWWYHSHVNEPEETNLGLLGPIIITRRGMARPDGSPRDVNREFVAAFFVFDELEDQEAGLMHSINGYIFGNLRGLEMNSGERVRWYLLGMGNEIDLHTPHWHGKTVQVGFHRTDVVELLPASMVTADMRADNPGTWMFHCHVSDHLEAGMMTTYTIR